MTQVAATEQDVDVTTVRRRRAARRTSSCPRGECSRRRLGSEPPAGRLRLAPPVASRENACTTLANATMAIDVDHDRLPHRSPDQRDGTRAIFHLVRWRVTALAKQLTQSLHGLSLHLERHHSRNRDRRCRNETRAHLPRLSASSVASPFQAPARHLGDGRGLSAIREALKSFVRRGVEQSGSSSGS